MTAHSPQSEAILFGLGGFTIAAGVAVFVIARNFGVDFLTAGEFVGWTIISLLILGGAAWYESRNHWEEPMIRLGTVWPIALWAVWQGVFNLLRFLGAGPEVDIFGREIPSFFAASSVAWYATGAFDWTVSLLILFGGYGFNFYRANR